MPMGRFLALTAVGSFAWNAALIGAGSLLADRWQAVLSAVSALAPYGVAANDTGKPRFSAPVALRASAR